jgi:hypothetical protein
MDGVFAEQQIDGLLAIASYSNIVGDVGFLKGSDSEEFVVRVIFDQENQFTVAHSSYRSVNQKVAP